MSAAEPKSPRGALPSHDHRNFYIKLILAPTTPLPAVMEGKAILGAAAAAMKSVETRTGKAPALRTAATQVSLSVLHVTASRCVEPEVQEREHSVTGLSLLPIVTVIQCFSAIDSLVNRSEYAIMHLNQQYHNTIWMTTTYTLHRWVDRDIAAINDDFLSIQIPARFGC